ncbi:MAG: hypothetical protein ACRCYB_00130 [Aeromonas veronii]
MKEYFKMSDVFPSEIYTDDESGSLIVDDEGIILESFSGDKVADYALHAINSHDELVEMNKELLELVREILNSGTFFISAVESDSFGVDFSDWEKRAAALVSSIQEKSA